MLKIKKIEKKISVYDMEVKDNHNFFANGILIKNCEIVQHTKPLKSLQDEDAEIGVCILSALNILEIKNDEELQSSCNIIVRLLEELIDYQEYPVKAAENFCKNRRSLGVGVTNFAAWLAKQKLLYDDEKSLPAVDELFEKIQYYMLRTSNELAKEKGACGRFADTKYARGLLPFEWANKNAVGLVDRKLSMDWEGLRADIKEWGLRHSTVSTIMPAESCIFGGCGIHSEEGVTNFWEICDKVGIDWRKIEEEDAIGWHLIPEENRIKVKTSNGMEEISQIYYNGKSPTVKITMEDGSIVNATTMHKFKVLNKDGSSGWKRVYDLIEDDDIVEIK